MIRLDATRVSVVAVCTCGWRTVALDKPAAWAAGAGHERAAHGGPGNAAQALRTALSRARRA